MSDSGFKLITRPPTKREERLFGIFVSHASADDERVDELCKKAEGTHIHFLHDGNFIHNGQDFNQQIHTYIKCYGCVLIVSKASLQSDWVQYECGYFSHSGQKVVLWDPDGLLDMNPARKEEGAKKETGEEKADIAATALLNFHLTQYLPVCRTAEEVMAELQHLSIYADLYTDACRDYSIEEFQKDLRQNVTTTMVHISSPLLSGKKELFKECKLSTLVVNFGMYYKDQGDGIHCWAERKMEKNKLHETFMVNEECLLPDGKCKHSGGRCTLYSEGGIDTNMKQCVILNHVIQSGRYIDKGQLDYSTDEVKLIEQGMLAFYVPVHRKYGTEFKFIVDAPNQAKHAELLHLFEKMDLDPTVSDSLNGWRIYLSIPDKPYQGFFRLEHLFHNKFLCPRAAVHPDHR